MKNSVKIFLSIIISGLVFSSISVYAVYRIHARDVSFTPDRKDWQVDNVSSALDELYLSERPKLKILNKQNEDYHPKQNIYSGYKEYTSTVDSELLIILTLNYSGYYENVTYNLTSTNENFSYSLLDMSTNNTITNNHGSGTATYVIKTSKVNKDEKITIHYSSTPGSATIGYNNITSSVQIYEI